MDNDIKSQDDQQSTTGAHEHKRDRTQQHYQAQLQSDESEVSTQVLYYCDLCRLNLTEAYGKVCHDCENRGKARIIPSLLLLVAVIGALTIRR